MLAPLHQTMKYLLQICCIFFLLAIYRITAQDHEYCYNRGNFSANSTYGRNLDQILSSMASNVSANGGFYMTTVGQEPQNVYALALCRGDSSAEVCFKCVNTSIQAITTKCPNQKEAISWGSYTPCIVRYANRSFNGILEMDPMNAGYNTGNITTNLTQFDQTWERLMVRLVNKASSGSSRLKFATGEENLTSFSKIYALMQCTPDISQSNCDFCLRQTVGYFQNCCHGKQGGYVQRPNCIFRWDLYPFYEATTDNSPQPSPPAAPRIPPPLHSTNTTTEDRGSFAPGTIVIIVVSTIILLSVTAFIFVLVRRRKVKQDIRIEEQIKDGDEIKIEESLQFNFSIISAATDNFSIENKLGEGGFGAVFKGTLPDGRQIAVKRLSINCSRQGELEFKTEVLLAARLQHRNLVRLLGFSLEGNERLIIYEFLPKSSLDNYIFDLHKRLLLNWETRYKIIGGIARGILYLHEDSRLRIIHRDLKASNILLDANLNPKVSDFGMAKLFESDQSQGNSQRIAGTFGYMAPEYALHGHYSVKSDVFSFGVLVLEIITGQKNTLLYNGEETETLLTHAWIKWKAGRAFDLIDPVLIGANSEMMRCLHIGLLCVQENEADRPTIASVVLLLSSCSTSLPIPLKPAFFMHNTAELDNSESKSKGKSDQFTVNEASITELDPR